MDWYAIIKDFAGPVATVIASVTAATITYRFGKAQQRIADAQATTAVAQKDIAYDKLKWDLFDKRYEIYTTAGDLIDHINGSPFDRQPGGAKIIAMMRKLDEARFFFPRTEAAVFATIARLVEDHEGALSRRNLFQDNEAVRIQAGGRAAEASQALSELRLRLPVLMEKELGFAQVTSSSNTQTLVGPPPPTDN
jgi:hypothetical protein